jgi:transposase
MVDEILKEMSPKFAKLYSDVGRPSIAPERLLRSLLLQIFYSVRSERMLIHSSIPSFLLRAGLRSAKAKGKRLRRPRVMVDHTTIAALRAEGLSWAKVGTKT